MHEPGPRVVLLARPGGARERLRAALNEAGAQLVLDADPTKLEAAELEAAQPQFVLVVLDATSEQAIERFDSVLLNPSIEVMFEEADIAARREGWDAARWIRHLTAKLHRHTNVLPPGAGQEPVAPWSKPAVRVAPQTIESIEPAAPAPGDALPMVGAVQVTEAAETVDLAETAETPTDEIGELSAAPAHPLSDDFTSGVEPGAFMGFDPVAAEIADAEQAADQIISFDFQLDGALSLDDLRGPATSAPADAIALDFDFEGELSLPGLERPAADPAATADGDDLRFGGLVFDELAAAGLSLSQDDGFDARLAASGPPKIPDAGDLPVQPGFEPRAAAALHDADDIAFGALDPVFETVAFSDAAEARSDDARTGGAFDGLELAFDTGVVPASKEAASAIHVDFEVAGFANGTGTSDASTPPEPRSGHGAFTLELVDDDAPAQVRTVTGGPDLAEIERRISSLQLVDDAPATRGCGAVLVLAGIGGPDAIRQLLSALPSGFGRPVIVHQKLEGGRYDKLVTQMQRASALPVELAAAGSSLQNGTVYIVPTNTGVSTAGAQPTFAMASPLIEALTPADSAVILLSGTDADVVDALAGAEWSNALVVGQAADGCYDPAASNLLAARGGQIAAPSDIAQRLADRWGAR